MLELKQVEDILFSSKKVILSEKEKEKVETSYNFLKYFAKHKVIYGINTGLGPMAQYRINDADLRQVQYNFIHAHASGCGEPIDKIAIKAALLSRYQTFVAGYSGVHLDTLLLLQELINREVIPFVPEHGGVGASGDLVQLAHIALAMIGEGEVFYEGGKFYAKDLFNKLNIKPLEMYIREGLALLNGTSVMTGLSLVNLIHAKKVLQLSLLSSCLINEIVASYDDFMHINLNEVKLHNGQRKVAEIMRNIASDGSCMRNRGKELYENENQELIFDKKVQPYYSLRCVPQVLGPIYDTIAYTEKVIINELNSVDDNPIVDYHNQTVYHGGNFHGDYISLEMDKLKIAITKLTMLAERQLNYLLHDKINGILPPFVNLGKLGFNYGLQGAQFTATSTTAECQTLSNPMYVHSIPNNNDNQDIVSMGTNSALLTKRVINNSFQVLSIHFLALSQAVDYLKIQNKLSSATLAIYNDIRAICPAFTDDVAKYKDIEKIINYLKTNPIDIKI